MTVTVIFLLSICLDVQILITKKAFIVRNQGTVWSLQDDEV